MMTSKKRRLKLVKFNPNDYSLAEILSRENSSVLDSQVDISSAFSLYFQWPEHRKALMSPDGEDWHPCEIQYDEDEREPSELFLSAAPELHEHFVNSQSIRVRFEIFRTCYEFVTEEILDLEVYQDDISELFLTINTPPELVLYKFRRIPRFPLSSELHGTWIRNDIQKAIQITSISPTSVSFEDKSKHIECKGILQLNGSKFSAQLTKRKNDEYVIILSQENASLAKIFFDIYRNQVYKNLHPRSEANPDEVLDLYDPYIKKYVDSSNVAALKKEVKETWEKISNEDSTVTADYIVTRSDSQKPVGASSLSLCFLDGSHEFWAFHQLATSNNPKNFDLTKILYTWRIDYLINRPKNLRTVFWFNGNSRWLERIYTKFTIISHNKVQFEAAKCTLIPKRPNVEQSEEIPYGKTARYLKHTEHLKYGYGPSRLNISNVLNNIVPNDLKHFDISTLHEINFSKDPGNFYVTTARSVEIDGEEFPNLSRYSSFCKEALPDFRACVEHSIAVSQRKYR